ncbi:MAG: hypothetical protein GTO02_00540 [Candidatus Dadabacteria bacterium]|nr:hypothetical protein [Candidatus Dadabacteria bacterium]NIQ12936.1 hypothetical protein [Candidatus Dadabacteria bacterium]
MKLKFLLIINIIFFVGCYSNWNNPNDVLPSTKVSVKNLLSHPAVYDKRGVKVKGKIWDIEYITSDFTAVSFKLADKSGNYIGVISKDILKIHSGDIIEVVGIFERNFDSENNKFESFVDAKHIKVVRNN